MLNYDPFILVDTGIIVAFYNSQDKYHQQIINFFSTCTSQLITTLARVTEVMWLLPNVRIQAKFLLDLSKGAFICENLIAENYTRINELNLIYQDLPADFTDLSLIAISERLQISAIATLDKDFDIYRRYRKEPFIRVFRPNAEEGK